MSPETTDKFLAFATIAISVLVGILIMVPLSMAMPGGAGFVFPILGALCGLYVGLRRRKSRPFLYMSMICAIILAWLVGINIPWRH